MRRAARSCTLRAMNTPSDVLYWHQSEVLRIQPPNEAGTPARLLLSAAALERDGVAGFLKPLELIFHDARLQGPLADCLGSIARGGLRIRTSPARELHHIALPWRALQPLQLTLEFRNGSTLLIEAAAAHCDVPPAARFVESYAC